MHEKIITCLNGVFLPAHEATIPVADRGFRFGDGVFETIALIGGVPYQWDLHLSRLHAGLAALRITAPTVDWGHMTRTMIAKNDATEGFLRISISRGVGSRGYRPNAGITPTWVIEYLPAAELPTQPLKLWASAIQRPSLTALCVNHKLAHGIGSTLALLDACDHDCDEALMLSSAHKICEAASGNIFWITDTTLYTPALETGCLAGTTRDAVIRLSPVPCIEIHADISVLRSAHSVFITNTRLGIWPVTSIEPLGSRYDAAHPILDTIAQRFAADRAAYARAHDHLWATA